MRKEGKEYFLEEGENLYCYWCGKECSRVWMNEPLPPEDKIVCKQYVEKSSKLKVVNISQKEAEQQRDEFQKWREDQKKLKPKREKLREFLKTNCSFSKKELEKNVESIISVDEKELEENGVPIECNGDVLMIWMKKGVYHSRLVAVDIINHTEKQFAERYRK